MVLGIKSEAVRVTNLSVSEVDELYCPEQEESDTRIFSHISSCTKACAVIQAMGRDIFLSMYHLLRLGNLEMLWVEKKNDFIPIHDMGSLLTDLVGEHSL